MKLLLLSNSTMKGDPYLAWPTSHLKEYLRGVRNLLFIPYAGVTVSYDDYTETVQRALSDTGVKITGIHTVEDKLNSIRNAECIAVGGGNTFHLLHMMQQYKLVEPIRKAVKSGTPYIGWSAGSNVACPTIKTTNDMPIVEPDSFEALALTDFQINAHYTDRVIEGHGGESRQLRLEEMLVANSEVKIVGLPEGKSLHFKGENWFLEGIDSEPTFLFTSTNNPVELKPGKIII